MGDLPFGLVGSEWADVVIRQETARTTSSRASDDDAFATAHT
jgi:hypothetical protein